MTVSISSPIAPNTVAVCERVSKVPLQDDPLAYATDTKYVCALVDMYAGGGGFSIGAHSAGVYPSIAVEWTDTKIKDFSKLFPDTTIVKAWLGSVTGRKQTLGSKKAQKPGAVNMDWADQSIDSDSECTEFSLGALNGRQFQFSAVSGRAETVILNFSFFLTFCMMSLYH